MGSTLIARAPCAVYIGSSLDEVKQMREKVRSKYICCAGSLRLVNSRVIIIITNNNNCIT